MENDGLEISQCELVFKLASGQNVKEMDLLVENLNPVLFFGFSFVKLLKCQQSKE